MNRPVALIVETATHALIMAGDNQAIEPHGSQATLDGQRYDLILLHNYHQWAHQSSWTEENLTLHLQPGGLIIHITGLPIADIHE